MRIIDYADYIMGQKSPWTLTKEPYRVTKEDLELGVELLDIHTYAKENLKMIKSPKLFYAKEPDMANDIPKEKREEIFYALKLGYASPIAPAKFIFFIHTAYREYGSPNFLFKLALEKDLQEFFSEGYVADGYTPRDVISSVIKQNFMPLSEGRLATQIDNHWDLYIHDTDAIAMVPSELKELLSHSDIYSLKVRGTKIYLGDKPITQLGNFLGAVNSCYDLRSLL